MTIEEKIFSRKRPELLRLEEYGFEKSSDGFVYTEKFMNGSFSARVLVGNDGRVSGKVFDLEADDEYRAFRDENRLGEFVGSVRCAFDDILQRIAESCFTDQPFDSDQANRIAGLIYKQYDEKPDFPFSTAPTYGVVRNPDNRKWYLLIMNITKDKLTGRKTDKKIMVDVANIKVSPEDIDLLKKEDGIYNCYHMSKGNWISVILDGTVTDERLMKLIGISRGFTLRKKHVRATKNENSDITKKWIVPSNPKYYDIGPDMYVGNEMIWKQGRGIRAGDIVYLYSGSPVSAIRCRAVVTAVNIPFNYSGKELVINSVMKMKIERVFEPDVCTFALMRKYGVLAVRCPRFMPEELEKKLLNR